MLNILVLGERTLAIADTHVNDNPTAEQVAEITIASARRMKELSISPKAALLSRSNFGTESTPSSLKMREALDLIREWAPELEVDGEMHGDCALDEEMRYSILPNSTLSGSANLLVCPNADAANIAYNLLKMDRGGNVAIGPFLLGANAPVSILTATSSVRRIINMTALTVLEANTKYSG